MTPSGPDGFVDHFSAVSADYARFRPRYPAALFSFLAGLAPRRELAWDCATGSGQAAVELASHFARVAATDASAEQLAHAQPHPRVEYGVAAAERSGLDDASVDLVTVAQALHWFHRPRFFAEARRVLVPGGVLAVWSYSLLRFDHPQLDAALERFHHDTVGPFWPPERRLVDSGYRTLRFPFPEEDAPPFAMRADLSLDDLGGYLRTWSATQRFVRAHGHDPVVPLLREIAPAWGRPERRRTARWPLTLRVGRA